MSTVRVGPSQTNNNPQFAVHNKCTKCSFGAQTPATKSHLDLFSLFFFILLFSYRYVTFTQTHNSQLMITHNCNASLEYYTYLKLFPVVAIHESPQTKDSSQLVAWRLQIATLATWSTDQQFDGGTGESYLCRSLLLASSSNLSNPLSATKQFFAC